MTTYNNRHMTHLMIMTTDVNHRLAH